MKLYTFPALLFLPLLLSFGCASPQTQPWAKPQASAQAREMRLARVTVQVPGGVESTGSDPRMDFMVTRFSKGGKAATETMVPEFIRIETMLLVWPFSVVSR